MQINNKPKLIIDTDPGHDDALAILMTVLSDQFEILGITTVAGNATIENVTRNTQAILNLIGSSIPIDSGLGQPLMRKLVTAVVHGQSGLAGLDTSKTCFELTGLAPERVVELVTAYPGEVTLLTLGPLTNIARALNLDRSLSSKVKQLVMMGGAIDVPGNKNRVAEFNFFVDPEAAEIVLQADIPKVLVPLDACNKVVLEVEDFKQITNQSLQSILIPMMEHFLAGLVSNEGTRGILVYDALAAYYLINPQAYSLLPMDVLVETKGTHTFGMCVTEKRQYKVATPNVEVVVGIDERQFRKDFFRILNGKEIS